MTTSEEDEKFSQWGEWAERIVHDVQVMHHHRKIWHGTNLILGENDVSGYFHQAFTTMYVQAQVMAVRRQADAKDSVVTLVRLLRSIQAHPGVITRERFLAKWSQLQTEDGDPHGTFSQWANAGFNAFGGPGGEKVDPAIVRADLEQLKAKSRAVTRWADQYAAHSNVKSPPTLTFAQLHDAVDHLGEVMNRYRYLLTGSNFAFIAPALGSPWWDVFERPLDIPEAVIEDD